MGKGDKKTKKGKIAMGSFGKLRPHDINKNKPAPAVEEPTAKEAKKPLAAAVKEEKK